MQDLDSDKSILDNLLFQSRRQMQKDINRRDFFKSLVEQVLSDSNKDPEDKRRDLRKKIMATKIQQLVDDKAIPPNFRELNLDVLLTKVHESKFVVFLIPRSLKFLPF